ncbi:MAG: glycosyltransferase family 2 protein [Capsulimonadales bacterium]|nr:glycosyltransferase family 2 protein [Capsulimonadales bacterium]
MRLSALIVNWNTAEDLIACLRALTAYPFTGEQEVIVVDNASADDSVARVRAEFPDVRLILNPENRIYAEAVNQAFAAATGDHLLLLNPDTRVCPGALDELARTMAASPTIGAVAARLTDETGATQPSVRGFPEPIPLLADICGLARLFPRHPVLAAYRQRFFDYDRPGPAPQPMTSCLLISGRCYKAVGGMDERFPLYFNDVDWCLRCHRAGFEIRYAPNAVVFHEGGGTTKKVRKAAIRESHRSLLRFYAKHYRATTPAPLYALIALLVTLGAWVRTGRWGEPLGREGGITTPEQLRMDFESDKRR